MFTNYTSPVQLSELSQYFVDKLLKTIDVATSLLLNGLTSQPHSAYQQSVNGASTSMAPGKATALCVNTCNTICARACIPPKSASSSSSAVASRVTVVVAIVSAEHCSVVIWGEPISDARVIIHVHEVLGFFTGYHKRAVLGPPPNVAPMA